jgi:hypothetical protein
MADNHHPSILIIGGSGLVGSQAARLFRQFHPSVPITIGGRDRERALAVARELGHADAAVIDLDRTDLGLTSGQSFGAIAVFLKDTTLASLRYAQSTGAAYLSISSGLFEMAPEVALYVHAPTSAAVVLGSQWLVGAATLATLEFAREFRRVDQIQIGAVLDDADMGGPAAFADYERLTTMTTSVLLLEDGKWRWVRGEMAERRFTDTAGRERLGQTYAPFDVVGLAAATDARSVRFDLVVGETASRTRGEGLSTELIIELEGERHDASRARVRHELIHPQGQAPLTALCVALLLERLVGLTGPGPMPPGLYFPEQVLAAAPALEQMKRFGLQHRRVEA